MITFNTTADILNLIIILNIYEILNQDEFNVNLYNNKYKILPYDVKLGDLPCLNDNTVFFQDLKFLVKKRLKCNIKILTFSSLESSLREYVSLENNITIQD